MVFSFLLTRTSFPLTRLAFGGLTVVGNVAFQAAQRGMSAKAFEVNFGVIMGCTQANGCMAQLVEIPVGGIAFPEGVSLPVGEARIAIGGEISTPRQTGFAMCHEERAGCWVPARRQILVEKRPDHTREEHLAWAVAFA